MPLTRRPRRQRLRHLHPQVVNFALQVLDFLLQFLNSVLQLRDQRQLSCLRLGRVRSLHFEMTAAAESRISMVWSRFRNLGSAYA